MKTDTFATIGVPNKSSWCHFHLDINSKYAFDLGPTKHENTLSLPGAKLYQVDLFMLINFREISNMIISY